MINTSWNWNNVDEQSWLQPADDVFYYLYTWKQKNLLKMLDLGCGIGRHSLLFASYGYKVTGFDLSESGLQKLNTLANENQLKLKTVLGNAKNLPFKNESFDCLLAYHAIYHATTPDMKMIINEVSRVLKKEGEVFISFISKSRPIYNHPDTVKVDENVRMKEEDDGSILPHYFVDEKDLKILLKDFEIINIKHTQYFTDNKPSWHYFVYAKKN